MDWASIFLADEIPLEEFCAVFERWWYAGCSGLSAAEISAAKVLMEAIAWYSEDHEACIPAGKARDEQSVRVAVMDFLQFMLSSRRLPGRH